MPADKSAPAAPSSTAKSGIELVLAYGVTGDHFWITASYADVIIRGAIPVAVRACKTKVPGFICDAAGTLLKNLTKGWSAVNNHGVWAAVYWWPPRVTGGRW